MARPTWLPDEPGGTVDLGEVDYLERQGVVVVTEPEVERIRSWLRAMAARDSRTLRKAMREILSAPREETTVAAMASASVQRVSVPERRSRLSPSRIMGAWAIGPVGQAFLFGRAYRHWLRASIGVFAISGAEAGQLTWPKGDPVQHELYIGSPVAPIYYPASSFHDDLLFERYGELRELITRLGASKIVARVLRGTDLGGSALADSPLPEGVGSAGGEVRADAHTEARRKDIREMVPAPPVPREQLESGLHWFQRESEWQRLADLRYLDRALVEELQFRNVNDFGLNASFQAALAGLPGKIKLGGSFKRFTKTTWEIEATFEPVSRISS